MPEEHNKYEKPVGDIETPEVPKIPETPAESPDEPLDREKEPALGKQEVFKAEKEPSSSLAHPSPPTPPSAPPTSGKIKKEIEELGKLDRQNQVKKLCQLAFEEGLNFSIEVAKNLDNAYVLDELHDTLIDELKEKLVEKGELKKL
jgi:hypothetical protein